MLQRKAAVFVWLADEYRLDLWRPDGRIGCCRRVQQRVDEFATVTSDRNVIDEV